MNENFKNLRILTNNYVATLAGLNDLFDETNELFEKGIMDAKKDFLGKSTNLCESLNSFVEEKFGNDILADVQPVINQIFSAIRTLAEDVTKYNRSDLMFIITSDAFDELNVLFEVLDKSLYNR